MNNTLMINNSSAQTLIQPKDFGCSLVGRNYNLSVPAYYDFIEDKNFCSDDMNMLC